MTDGPATAELLALPVEFEHGGKKYKSRRLDLAGVGEFCAWLERQSLEKAWFGSANLSPDARESVLKAANENVAAGVFQVGGSGYLKALTQAAPGAYLLYLGLRDEYPELTLDDCTTMFLAEYDRRARDALEGLGHPNSSGDREASSGPPSKSSPSSRKKASRRRKR